MPNPPTPGQVAYAAYRAAYGDADWIPTWTDLLAESHHAWEAAAQAVRAWPPCWQFALGQAVRWHNHPGLFTVVWRRVCERGVMRWMLYGIRRDASSQIWQAHEPDLQPTQEAPHA